MIAEYEKESQVLNYIRGLPQYLKGIPVYPVKMKDALAFYDSVVILNLDKNKTDDVEILKMSYLKYLLLLCAHEEFLGKFTTLLKLIFRTEDISIEQNEKGKFFLVVDGCRRLSEFDFNNLKVVIAEQNMIGLDDENMNPELKQALKEAEEFYSKRGNKPAPFSQRVLAYEYEMKKDLEEIMNMTIYHFNSSLEVVNHIKQSDILQQARFAGMKQFKDEEKLPTWLSAIEKNKDNPLLLNADKLTKDMKSMLGT